MNRKKKCGQTLVGVLVSVFLMIALAVFFLMPRGGNDGTPGKTVLKRSMDKGEGVALNSNINQIQQGITMYKDSNDGKPPASLDELKHYLKDYPPEMWENPIDHKPLVYDPTTGTISAQPENAPANVPSSPNPPAPGANPPAPAAPSSPTGPGGIHMNIPAPGAGAADAMKE